jgi:hypothetical protein
MQVFFSGADPVSEAYALVEILSQWLVEQKPEQPIRPATARFKYGADGSLRTVNVVLVEDDE